MTAPSAWAVVDHAAIASNLARLRDAAMGAEVMPIVKADAYGHGLIEVSATARACGAEWLGVAMPAEARALREAGDTGRILVWLLPAGTDMVELVRLGVDVSVSSLPQLASLMDAARGAARPVRLQLKVDTGLSRGGLMPGEWEDAVVAAAAAQAAGDVTVTGIWSHLAHGDEPHDPMVDQQADRLRWAVGVAAAAGIDDVLVHLSNSGATLARPDLRFDLVRTGIALYGLPPGSGDSADAGLVPAMSLRSRVALVKEVPGGSGVSYGHRYVTASDTRLALVPLGYADGIPRSASNAGEVLVGGRRVRISGTVCMDQVMLDLGAGSGVRAGDEVIVFGSGAVGEPTAQDWARACGTIPYEIVTRVGARVERVHVPAGDRA